MRLGKLYIKILFSFLAILLTTLVVVFALFLALPGSRFTTRLEEFAKNKALIVKAVVEEKIQAAPTTDLSENGPLKDFVLNFAQILGTDLWIQKPDGTISLQSFSGEIPETVARLKKRRVLRHGDIAIYHRRDGDFYAVIPIAFPGGETGSVQLLFDNKAAPFHPGEGFAFGLAMIGLCAALLIVPVSRIITNRLDKLRRSALTIAEGNLSHRADIRGKDEIGELARAFNRMADKLETMIQNGKALTANVSHELRTPLTRIRIAEEMLREKLGKIDSGPYERHLNEVREDIQELDHLLGRILELSKLDLRDSPLQCSALDLSELIPMLLHRFDSVIEHKHLQVSTDVSCHPPLSGDREVLTTALLNILDNAAKFTPERGMISVQVHPISGFVEISITNTFEELKPEELSRIFNPFHRAKRSQATGSGLGLAIAKKGIERHGGTIEAHNGDRGLEIRISLPNPEGSTK